jgi:cation transport regulator ChaB
MAVRRASSTAHRRYPAGISAVPARSTGSRLRRAGWFAVPVICLVLFLALSFQVNAVKREVRLAEREIIALEREKMMLETEFQSRASQRQLAAWNAIEFGYAPPSANQFLDGEQQLARLGTPRARSAPNPIRVAMAPVPRQEHVLPDWARDIAEAASLAANDLADNTPARADNTASEAANDGRSALDAEYEADSAGLAQRLTRSLSPNMSPGISTEAQQ